MLDDVQPLEYVCNENERDRAHMVGTASDLRSVKLDPKLLAEYAGAYEYKDPITPRFSTCISLRYPKGSYRFQTARDFSVDDPVTYDVRNDQRRSV